MPKTRVGLFVGRFQPFHNGHLAAVRYALDRVDYLYIVVGSAQKSHERYNPFTAGEQRDPEERYIPFLFVMVLCVPPRPLRLP